MNAKFQPSPAQQAVYDWVETGEGSAVVEAVAGAGKTTTLVGAVERMRGSVFLGAFNTKMASELKERTSRFSNVKAATFHSAGFGALRYRVRNIEVDKTAKKVRNIAQRMTHDTPNETLVPAISKLVGLAKQSGFFVRGLVERPGHADWDELIWRHEVDDLLPDDGDSYDMTGALISLSERVLRENNAITDFIDFDDMIYLPLLMGCRFFRNDWVLIDEAQDTNATRREMARRMLAPGGRLIAVGDPHQAIFGFTGADGDSLDRIRRDFSAITLDLTVTYRCPKAVVRAAQEFVSHIQAAPTAPEGAHEEMTLEEMIKFAAPGDAIVCRFNKHLVSLCFKLIREGKAAKIEGKSIGEGLAALAGKWKVKTIDALAGRLQKWHEREVAKARAKEDEAKEERLDDQYETMRVLMMRAVEQDISTVSGLKEMIVSMFDDVGESRSLVVLSSVHKSKGLEWDRVFIYGRRELMPSRRVRHDWQREQEINLIYVALTRAKETIVDVALDESREKGAALPNAAGF